MAAPEQPNLTDDLQRHISNYLGMERGNWGDSDNAWQEILTFIEGHYDDTTFDHAFNQSMKLLYVFPTLR